MLPMNLIGELAKVISISFRLFGNMMGGSIIILVVSYLIYSLILPPFLYAFFSLFIGTIQAFVFTMLTVVYIAVQVE
jgi:F-type H+-transporting ATPase subunit a